MQDQLKIIENALNWQQEGPRRSVDIKVEPEPSPRFSIWCYDYNLKYGEYAKDDSVVDLDAGSKSEKLKRLQELKKELEGEQ